MVAAFGKAPAVPYHDFFKPVRKGATSCRFGGRVQPRAGRARIPHKLVQLNSQESSVFVHKAAVDHDALDRAAVVGMDQLVDGIVERHQGEVVQLEKDDVSLVAGGDAA